MSTLTDQEITDIAERAFTAGEVEQEVFDKSFRLFVKIIVNIGEFPDDPKYRGILLSVLSQKTIPLHVAILKEVGFVEEGDRLVFPEDGRISTLQRLQFALAVRSRENLSEEEKEKEQLSLNGLVHLTVVAQAHELANELVQDKEKVEEAQGILLDVVAQIHEHTPIPQLEAVVYGYLASLCLHGMCSCSFIGSCYSC